jgi:acyl-CoA hydrolase
MHATVAASYQGKAFARETVGELRDSTALVNDGAALRERMDEDGYLLLRGVLDRQMVQAARLEVLARLAARGTVDDRGHPLEAGIYNQSSEKLSFLPDVTVGNTAMHEVLRSGQMIRVFERLLEGEIRCFDYTWFRVKTPGTETATTPHCDSIYMGTYLC